MKVLKWIGVVILSFMVAPSAVVIGTTIWKFYYLFFAELYPNLKFPNGSLLAEFFAWLAWGLCLIWWLIYILWITSEESEEE